MVLEYSHTCTVHVHVLFMVCSFQVHTRVWVQEGAKQMLNEELILY